jgi:hypothetical protein
VTVHRARDDAQPESRRSLIASAKACRASRDDRPPRSLWLVTWVAVTGRHDRSGSSCVAR